MQFDRFHGISLIFLALMLLGLQTILYMTTRQVVTGPPGFSTAKLEHETYPVPGILGTASLLTGVVILVTRRRAGEPKAKTAV
jgi:hypothetical protein